MIPWQTIEKVRTKDGTELALCRRGEEWMVRCDGKPLMSTRQHGSEEALAALALEKLKHPKRILVGGLGLGFTARAALDRIGKDAEVVIAEFTPALVEWNKKHVGEFAGNPLEDPRATVLHVDAVKEIYRAPRAWDALLLDIDNGPAAMVHDSNHRLYSASGIAACYAALRPGGALSVWSSGPDAAYLKRLIKAGFNASAHTVGSRGGGGGVKHTIFVGLRPV
jgi:spermidine synthase